MASRSVNKVILLGHLGKDAETKFTPGGVSRCKFTHRHQPALEGPAVGRMEGRDRLAQLILWRSENIANYLLKGKQVYVEGRLQSRSYEDKEGQKRYITEVVCEADSDPAGRSAANRAVAAAASTAQEAVVSRPRSAPRPQPPLPARRKT